MKFVALCLLVLSFSAFSAEQYTSTVKQTAQAVTISVKSEVRSSMCGMEITKLSLSNPHFDSDGETVDGTIEVEFKTSPFSLCMMAFGPHTGQLVLKKESSLPGLKSGVTYDLIVNGQTQESKITVK